MTFPDDFVRDLEAIVALLDEAYDHYFANGGDGSKMSEGYIEVGFPNYFSRKEGATSPGIGIYSYVFGPGRMHRFDSMERALAEVQRWHDNEMEATHEYLG